MNFSTRVTELLGIRYPIIQAGMSWASSNAELALAVSQAGALGMIAAGPMYPDALRAAIRTVKDGTDKPFAVNVPLYNPRAAASLDIVLAEKVPIIVASQGGPKQHLARFKDHGVTWLHVTASPEHARKAEDAGVDAVIAVGTEAGGHPPPDEIGTLVVVRAVVKAVRVPVIAGTRTALTTARTTTSVPISSGGGWPPASVPTAMTASTPASSALRACSGEAVTCSHVTP